MQPLLTVTQTLSCKQFRPDGRFFMVYVVCNLYKTRIEIVIQIGLVL